MSDKKIVIRERGQNEEWLIFQGYLRKTYRKKNRLIFAKHSYRTCF
jgi:hypothetical protein